MNDKKKADTPWFDSAKDGPFGFSMVGTVVPIIEAAMSTTCASNLLSLVCQSTFKKCVKVERKSDSQSLVAWVPSLLCRSECERHQVAWKVCLADIERDANTKDKFYAAMETVVLY